MGQVHVETRSVCEFPRTFNESVLDALRANETADEGLGPEACTQTFGQALGTPWLLAQILIACFHGLYSIPVILRRYRNLSKYARSVRKPMRQFAQTRVYACALAISIAIVVEMIDPLGLHDIMPGALYFICDEIIGATCFVLALVIVDFWCLCAKGTVRHSVGLPKRTLRLLCFLPFVNFLGFEIVGIIRFHEYFIWEGIKMFGGVILLLIITAFAFVNLRIIERTLRAASNLNSGSSSEGASENQSTNLTSNNPSETQDGSQVPLPKLTSKKSFTGKLLSRNPKPTRSNSEIAIQQLRRKYRQFYAVVAFASLAMAGNGVLAITRPEDLLSWGYSVFEIDTFAISTVLKCVYTAVIYASLLFFKVPKVAPAPSFTSIGMSPSKDSMSSPTQPRIAASGRTTGHVAVPSENDPAVESSYENIPPPPPLPPNQQQQFLLPPPPPPPEPSPNRTSRRRPNSLIGKVAAKVGFDPNRPRRVPKENAVSFYDMDTLDRPEGNAELLAVLRNPHKRAAFIAFCTPKHAEENIVCWKAMDDLEKICKAKGSDSPEAQDAAVTIINEFVVPEVINISANNMSKLKAMIGPDGNLNGPVDRSLLRRAKKELCSIMAENFLDEFLAMQPPSHD